MSVEFSASDDGTRLAVFDPIMRHRTTVWFPGPVRPHEREIDFTFPVERTVTVETAGFTVESPSVQIYTADGSHVTNLNPETDQLTLDPGEYYIGANQGVKLYLNFETAHEVTITPDQQANESRFELAAETELHIGARSLHERPEATITTTAAPHDLMAAISQFGSALKTTAATRSYPSLRGQPPALELGDDLHVPDKLSPPDTGITLELPPERQAVFAAAPVAYYLGARVEPGDEARVRTETGVDQPIDVGWGVEHGLHRLLQRTFTLDLLLREGYGYSLSIRQREEFEAETDHTLDGLLGAPSAERLDAYLDIPWSDVDPYVPDWQFGAHVAPVPDSVTLLSTLSDKLALIHPPRVQELVDSFTDLSPTAGGFGGGLPARDADPTDLRGRVFRPESLDVPRQVWVGPGTPVGVEMPQIEAIKRSHDRDPLHSGIDYVVVCNDERMLAEDQALRDFLTDNAGLRFDVQPYRNLSRSELRTVLETEGDVFHFVGHTDDDGFQCTDGKLATGDLDTVAADVCFLNSCDSYAHGRQLVQQGAIAAIATLGEVDNSVATTVGAWTAGLINFGLPVGGAVRLATDAHAETDRYGVIGHGSFRVVFPDGGDVDVILDADDDRIAHTTSPAVVDDLGVEFQYIRDDTWYGALPQFEYRCAHERAEYLEYLEHAHDPVVLDGDLYWSDELSPADL